MPLNRPPLTTNEAWNSHWRKRSTAKKQVEQIVGGLARQAGAKDLGPSVVSITWYAPDKRLRDSDSLAEFQKAVLDGLVKAGVWPDDHCDYVKQTRLAVDKTETRNPRIEIRIWEVGNTGIEMVGTG